MALPAQSATAQSAPMQLRSAPGGVLVLPLPPIMRFDALRLTLRELFAGGQFAGARVRLELTTRDLDMLEIRRLVHLLKDDFEVEVIGLSCPSDAIQRMAERELKLKISPTGIAETTAIALVLEPTVEESATEIVAGPVADDEAEDEGSGRVLSHHGTIRSGGVIRFQGDVQVFGDVNPGAHIIAGGNILVFGALKGLAHAGTRDEKAFIIAFDLRPTQLRIGKVIGLSIDSEPDRPTRAYAPEIAFISQGGITVEPYRGRAPTHASKETT